MNVFRSETFKENTVNNVSTPKRGEGKESESVKGKGEDTQERWR